MSWDTSKAAATESFALASLPFDLYQRHKLVQEAVEQIRDGRPRLAILDVGGSPGHLKAFLPRDGVVVVDREGRREDVHLLAEAFALPFADGAFDVVVSLDTLEHVARTCRAGFVKELARVTRDALLLTAPFDGPRVAEAESILDGFLRHRLKMDHRFLGEHLEHGLPERAATSCAIARLVGPVVAVPNGCLDRWLLMMGLSFYLDADPNLADLKRQVSAYYNRDHYRHDNAEPAYRYLLAARRPPAVPLDTAGLVAPPAAESPDFTAMAVLMEATGIDLLKEAYASIGVLHQEMGSKDVHAANLQAECDHRQRVIENLEAEIGRRQKRIEALGQEVQSGAEALRERGQRLLELKQAEIERRAARIAGLEKHAAKLEAEAERRGERIARLVRHAADLEQKLSNRSERVAGLEAHAANLQAALAGARAEVEALRSSVATLEAHLGEQMRHSADLDLALRQSVDLLAAAHSDLDARGREAADLAARLAALRGSRGVRLLKRVRALQDPD